MIKIFKKTIQVIEKILIFLVWIAFEIAVIIFILWQVVSIPFKWLWQKLSS